jgi:hypothetical protein
LVVPCATSTIEVLQRPLESAQYVSLAFGRRCRAAGIERSMGGRGSAYDTQKMMAPVALRFVV